MLGPMGGVRHCKVAPAVLFLREGKGTQHIATGYSAISATWCSGIALSLSANSHYPITQ